MTKAIFRTYAEEIRRHLPVFLLVFFGAIGVQAAGIASPLVLRQFFNLLATGGMSPDTVHGLLVLVAIVAAVALGEWACHQMRIYSIMVLEARIMADLYVKAFDYLIGHSYHFFVSRFSGTLTRKVSKFAGAFESITDAIMLTFFPAALFAIGAVTVLFIRNHTLGVILGVWVVGFVCFQLYAAKLRQPLRVARSEADSRMVGALSDAISNQNTIALFSGKAYEHGLLKGIIELWHKATMRSWKSAEIMFSVQSLLMVGINVGLLYGAVIFWQRGLVTVGDFVLIQSYLIGLFNQLNGISREVRRFYDSFADAEEMMGILTMPHEIRDIQGALPLATSASAISFNDVDFGFGEQKPVLENFTLHIAGGEKIALVGPSGAGKTTVTKLLLRLYDVSSGSIEIDGQNIASVTQESLRNKIAFVPQEPILFHRTLMENIRYGRRDATDEEVYDAARKAHCHEFIDALPEKYGTFVGERGVKLSGGERQRVAIARAILKNAPILVLDEATSSLDSESEALIQDALHTLMEGKTVVVIAHRLSTIMKMDRIAVIENGRVEAEGSHRELLTQGGLYQKLWSIQAGGFTTDEAEEPGESGELVPVVAEG